MLELGLAARDHCDSLATALRESIGSRHRPLARGDRPRGRRREGGGRAVVQGGLAAAAGPPGRLARCRGSEEPLALAGADGRRAVGTARGSPGAGAAGGRAAGGRPAAGRDAGAGRGHGDRIARGPGDRGDRQAGPLLRERRDHRGGRLVLGDCRRAPAARRGAGTGPDGRVSVAPGRAPGDRVRARRLSGRARGRGDRGLHHGVRRLRPAHHAGRAGAGVRLGGGALPRAERRRRRAAPGPGSGP